MNYKIAEKIIPDPESLLESIRSVGYSIREAISDLIDNSISAKATDIRINFTNKSNGELYFDLTDNGHGMDKRDLVSALRQSKLFTDSLRFFTRQ